MEVIVRRRFPFYEATLRIAEGCDAVKAALNAGAEGDRFVLRSTRHGIYGVLAPLLEGHLAPNGSGGCDVQFRVSYPRIWWAAWVILFGAMSVEIFKAPTTGAMLILLLCIAVLAALALVPLPMRGSAFARHVDRALAKSGQ
ncbi:MAG TPA: hypothetical protein VL284_19290 [Thermoanaerobaculia bacterium]|nr:hypothetical protein [Thermoanaerobaculia bacterium]